MKTISLLLLALVALSCNKPNKLRSYQVQVYNDSTVIYDGNRKVGTIPYDSTSSFDKLINKDNE